MRYVWNYPAIIKACECLVCDSIPAQMDRAVFMDKLLALECSDRFACWAAVNLELAALTEDELMEACVGDEEIANQLLSDEARDILDWLFTELSRID